MATWVTQFRKGLVELCILRTVERGETYGYRLVKQLREVPNLEFTESTVYPALARLIEEGLVQAQERASPTGPPRRYLSLSASGKVRLDEMTDHWAGISKSVASLMEDSQESK